MQLEVTLDRIGGTDTLARVFGPTTLDLAQSAVEQREVPSAVVLGQWMRLTFVDWVPVNDEWTSCRIEMANGYGSPVATRPALIFRKPYDVPTYTTFQSKWPDDGVFSLGLRALAAC